MLFRFHLLVAVACLAAFTIQAETIQWFSDAEQVNQDSGGSAMDAGFVFELGVFSGGFVPSHTNMSSWRANWVPADTTSYNAANKRFVDSFSVVNNTAPFTQGASAWIFGYRDTAYGSEWLLFRNSAWTWPAPNPLNPLAIEWNVKNANQNQIVLGAINSSGAPFLMKSVALQSFAQWQTVNLAGDPLNGPNDDPDLDGVSNLLEFVFGTSPKTSNAPTATPITLVGGNMQISIPRRIDRLANLVVEVSGNLTNWNSGASHTQVVANDASALVVRDLTTIDAVNPKRFMRLRASLP